MCKASLGPFFFQTCEFLAHKVMKITLFVVVVVVVGWGGGGLVLVVINFPHSVYIRDVLMVNTYARK